MLWYIYDDKACFEFLIFMQIKTAFLLHCRGMENFFYGHEHSIYFSFFCFFNFTSVHGSFIKDEKKIKL